MIASLLPFPPQAEALRLYHRLCTGTDPTASADVCQAYLAWLRHRNRGVDPHLIESAVHQALFDLVQRPHSYDPGRRSLCGYLQMAARDQPPGEEA
jgi:hypothetical protein